MKIAASPPPFSQATNKNGQLKKQRSTFNDQERSFHCTFCDKTYMSKTAQNGHERK